LEKVETLKKIKKILEKTKEMSKALGLLALSNVGSREEVVKLKAIAVRRGLWFKVLSALERAVVDLTIKVVERVRSPVLKEALKSIASKVVEALKSRSFSSTTAAQPTDALIDALHEDPPATDDEHGPALATQHPAKLASESA